MPLSRPVPYGPVSALPVAQNTAVACDVVGRPGSVCQGTLFAVASNARRLERDPPLVLFSVDSPSISAPIAWPRQVGLAGKIGQGQHEDALNAKGNFHHRVPRTPRV